MGTELGLRELKKRMTRESIANAALELTVAKGLSNVTLEDIARKAFVSPRTISNYFSSKEEAVLAAGTTGTEKIFDAFSDAPGDAKPLELLCRIVSDYAREHPDHLRQTAQMLQLDEDNPTLRPFRAAQIAEAQDTLRLRIAARTGRDADTDMYPTLAAAAAIAAITTAVLHWIKLDAPDDELPEMLEDAFNIVSDGYPHHPVAAASPGTSAEVPSHA